ncbi:MAG: hypothetical protein HYT21_00585 [Candidatus Nealsonbacteria bacterium]|nr:hypothetical protein [Candidatus Nealsonbacteria bacterium]
MQDLRGIHWGNFLWLDPFGLFPQKPSEKPGISDSDLFESMIRRMRDFRPKSIKVIIHTYAGDQNQNSWLEVQARIIERLHQEFPGASIVLRLEGAPYADANEQIGLAKAPLMARDFAPIINYITQRVQDDAGQPPIWLIIENEPNHPISVFYQRPAYFNQWFKTVVWHFWNVYPILNKPGSLSHGLFYPGLSPNYDDVGWYNHPSTVEILNYTIVDPFDNQTHLRQCWANGIIFHCYWQTGHGQDPTWGGRYKLLWGVVAQYNPYFPVMIGEWGNSSNDDMDAVKTPEYKDWLSAIAVQSVIPNILATALYILDSSDPQWSMFILTENACREIGQWM